MHQFKFIKHPFDEANKGSDFSTFVPATPLTRKQRLIEECGRRDVSIYIDDLSEQSALFRSIASEAELERRLNSKEAITLSKRANAIALSSLIVSAFTLFKSFHEASHIETGCGAILWMALLVSAPFLNA
jgi:hypothetical protein